MRWRCRNVEASVLDIALDQLQKEEQATIVSVTYTNYRFYIVYIGKY